MQVPNVNGESSAHSNVKPGAASVIAVLSRSARESLPPNTNVASVLVVVAGGEVLIDVSGATVSCLYENGVVVHPETLPAAS